MSQEEPEVSDELRELKNVTDEVAQHTARISKAHRSSGGLNSVALTSEFVSTLLPLLEDLSKAQLNHAAFMEDWLSGVEEDVADGGNAPDLSTEEIDLFKFLLARLRDFLQGVLSQAADAPPEVRAGFLEIEVKLNIGEKILERLTSDEEEEEDSEGDLDGDDDTDADD